MSATTSLIFVLALVSPQGQSPASRPAEPVSSGTARLEPPAAIDTVDESIAAGELYAHVAYLASDELEGRYTGSAGGVLAAEYLAKQLGRLEAYGLLPAGDELPDGSGKSFLQDVHLPGIGFTELPAMAVAGGEPLEYGAEFELRAGFDLTGSLDVVVCSDVDALPAAPRADAALYFDMFASKARKALRDQSDEWKAGWGAILERGSKSPGRSVTEAARIVRVRGPERPLVFEVSGAGREAVESAAAGGTRLELSVGGKPKYAYNVVALLPATTPLAAGGVRESVVMSAHYDHLRQRAVAAGEDGIFNGADDDASGVAAVLEITEALCLSEQPRGRDLVVLLATGEEIGLVGTVYYIEHPVAPLASTTANLNFEMLGRADALAGGPGKLWLTGFEHTNLGAALAADGMHVVIDPRPEQHFFERSDNYAFVLKGIIGQSLSSYNLHTDYHHVTDETDTLDFEHLLGGTKIGLAAARKLLDGQFRVDWSPDYSLPRR